MTDDLRGRRADLVFKAILVVLAALWIAVPPRHAPTAAAPASTEIAGGTR